MKIKKRDTFKSFILGKIVVGGWQIDFGDLTNDDMDRLISLCKGVKKENNKNDDTEGG